MTFFLRIHINVKSLAAFLGKWFLDVCHLCLELHLIFFFFPWLHSSHGFSKHAREQYEKLSTMHKNMQKLYESIGSYFAFDPHSVSVEDFFGELANFRMLFMVSGNLLFMHLVDSCCCFNFQSRCTMHSRGHHLLHRHVLHLILLQIRWWYKVFHLLINTFLSVYFDRS